MTTSITRGLMYKGAYECTVTLLIFIKRENSGWQMHISSYLELLLTLTGDEGNLKSPM